MIVAFIPTAQGTICIIGMTTEDTDVMRSRDSEPATIDMHEAVNRGIAIPSYVQIIYVADREEFDRRIHEWLASFGLDATDKMMNFDQLPKIFGEDDRG